MVRKNNGGKEMNPGETRNFPGPFHDSKMIWLMAIAAFAIMSLWPIWSVRFLPMQDYPQHLLQAHMLHSSNNPALNYNDNFVFHLRVGPYMTFFATMILLLKFLPVEIAGKISISVYILMVTLLAIKLSRRSKVKYFTPWGLLLFFPFSFNQQYFFGNVNYLLSIPLLIFAMIDYEELTSSAPRTWPILRHLPWQLALFFTHPFTFLIYISLALVGGILLCHKRAELKRALVAILIAVMLFLVWFVAAMGTGTVTSNIFATDRMSWLPFSQSLVFYGYMFTGMRWYEGTDKISVILWMAVATVVIQAFLTGLKRKQEYRYRYLLFFALTTIGVFILPFSKGSEYTFISLRVSAISYFFLTLFIGKIEFKGTCRAMFIILIAACVIHSANKQRRISDEVQEIVPMVEKIPRNSLILPLVLDNDTPELDRFFFDIHLHDHNYYHLLVGGGLSPYFFKLRLAPVHYKPDANRPAPGECYPDLFRWEDHASDYQYFLVRGAPRGFIPYMEENANLVSKSGKWILFKRKTQE